MTIRSRAGVAALLVATGALWLGAFAFGVYAGTVGWDWTPVVVFATLGASAGAAVLLLNSRE